jgi:putative chitinase
MAKQESFCFVLSKLLNSSIKDLRQQSYTLASIKHECGNTFEPIVERGQESYFDKYESNTSIGKTLGNKFIGDGFLFRGRGYAMITGRANYQRFGDLLGIDLVGNPDLACDPEISWKILELGMVRGLFTGRKLSDYFNDDKTDWLQARRIINGLDRNELVASYARQYYEILKELIDA